VDATAAALERESSAVITQQVIETIGDDATLAALPPAGGTASRTIDVTVGEDKWRISIELVVDPAIRGRGLGRLLLAHEQEVVNNCEDNKSEYTPANYEFREAGRDGDGARVVQIKPRRQDVMLVEGRAVLNEVGDLLRVEGKLAKNPSFWTTLVNIVRRYARIGGVRVPVATETFAKLKFIGAAQMEVLYDYQSVNGHPVALSAQRSAMPARIAGR